MPERDAADVPRPKSRAEPKYRVPAAELVQRAARRVVRGGKASFPSQYAFREAILTHLRRDEPLAAIGGARLRRLLVGLPGVRMHVRYTERHDLRPLDRCPVCSSALTPIRNRTLTGDTVALGQRCQRCDYWTHAARRVPVRYTFSQAGSESRAARKG